MDGLRTSRVLILEDKPEAAMPLIRALALQGIGAVYLTGSDEEIEAFADNPLKGIRVVFTDMELIEGTGGTDRAIVTQTAAVLRRVLGRDSEPLVIVTWSVNAALVDEFEKAVVDGAMGSTDLQPLIVRELPKSELLGADAKEVLEAAVARLTGLDPLTLLWNWEQRVHDAATATTDGLAAMIGLPAVDQDWLEELRGLLGGLGQAAAGDTAETPEHAVSAVMEALNPLHEDRLAELARTCPYSGNAGALLNAIEHDRDEKGKALSQDVRRALNRMLQFESEPPGHVGGAPGAVYLREGWDPPAEFPLREEGEPIELGTIPRAHVLEHVWKKAWPPSNAAEILSDCLGVLLEITPECDYSQSKAPRARLLAGLFVPVRRDEKILNREYVKRLPVARFPQSEAYSLDGDYVLVLDALQVVSLPREILAAQRSLYRLRAPALADVRAWFGRHAARPGHITLNGE